MITDHCWVVCLGSVFSAWKRAFTYRVESASVFWKISTIHYVCLTANFVLWACRKIYYEQIKQTLFLPIFLIQRRDEKKRDVQNFCEGKFREKNIVIDLVKNLMRTQVVLYFITKLVGLGWPSMNSGARHLSPWSRTNYICLRSISWTFGCM